MTINRWYRLTRTPSFLVATAVGILGAGVVLALVLSHLRPTKDSGFLIRHYSERGAKNEALDSFVQHMKKPGANFYEGMDLLAVIAKKETGVRMVGLDNLFNQVALQKAATDLKWPKADLDIATLLLDCITNPTPSTNEQLQKLSSAKTRHAAYALGTCYREHEAFESAAIYYEAEGRNFDHADSRKLAVHLYVKAEKKDKLAALKNDPSFEKHFDKHTRLDFAVLERDLPTIISLVIPTTFVPISKGVLVLGIITGLMWLTFSLQSSHYLTKTGLPWVWVGLLAVALGVLSIPVTHFFIALQEGWLNIKESNDPVRGVLFFFVGVGLREELAKLICFLPLIPILRHRNQLEVLVAASCVGLGFAIFENFSYYSNYGILVAPTRFLTANFFHMAATGVVGLYAFRALTGRDSFEEFLSRFGIIVAIHGGYDALLSVPMFRDYQFFATMAYIYLCYLYFHELRELRTSGSETISLTFTFTVGVAVVLSTTLIYLSELLPVWSALGLTVQTGLQLAILIFMFFRELPESLVA